jgi:hypothetical protein
MGDDERQTGYVRDESEAQRLDRNYNEQLQELRVAETGVQILFAFLLSISFQQRFATISQFLKVVYVITLILTALAAAMFIAPVAMHRAIFRMNKKDELVAYTAKLTAFGLVFLALSMLGAVLLIMDFVVHANAAWIATALMAVVFGVLWYLLPIGMRRHLDKP